MAGPGGPNALPEGQRIRLDKWLWQARFHKTRALAAATVEEGHLRLNGTPCRKPGHALVIGDTLTLAFGGRIRVIRVVALGLRRGPAQEAQSLYIDLDAPPAAPSALE